MSIMHFFYIHLDEAEPARMQLNLMIPVNEK